MTPKEAPRMVMSWEAAIEKLTRERDEARAIAQRLALVLRAHVRDSRLRVLADFDALPWAKEQPS